MYRLALNSYLALCSVSGIAIIANSAWPARTIVILTMIMNNVCQPVTAPRSILHNQFIDDGLIARQPESPIAIDRRLRIKHPMELQVKISWVPLSRGARPHTFNLVGIMLVPSNSHKSRNLSSDCHIAGNDAGSPTAIRLARSVYIARVDAEGFL
ncbi:hypothetical protein Pdw03_8076 [Penicillium digitatum]|jgi:hypothetical protein|uniref:Uncharacterized protein n=1 Tax=Penicillium digitatum TaxID=36651 RepID=A0A7T6XMW4_PENDI|nr:hypothetical protein Pdw03_8076 [Penicillium digitatum]